MPFGDRGRLGSDRPGKNPFGGIQVAFHQNRWETQNVPDVVKSIPDVIRWKFARGVKIHSDQISDRVFIFETIEPTHRHASCGRLGISIRMIKDRFNVLDELLGFRARRELLFFGWHRAGLNLLDDIHPDLSLAKDRIRIRKASQYQFGLRIVLRMAFRAILFDEAFPQCLVIGGRLLGSCKVGLTAK